MLLGGAALLVLHVVLNRGFSAKLNASSPAVSAAPKATEDDLPPVSSTAPLALPQTQLETTSHSGSASKYYLDIDRLSLEERFEERCKFWAKAVTEWKQRHDALDNPEVLTAIQYRSGAGDRLSGLLTALNHAMQRGRPLKFFWEDLDAAFQVAGKVEEMTGQKLIEMDAGKR